MYNSGILPEIRNIITVTGITISIHHITKDSSLKLGKKNKVMKLKKVIFSLFAEVFGKSNRICKNSYTNKGI